jgi:ParB family chromosome partitioning protein
MTESLDPISRSHADGLDNLNTNEKPKGSEVGSPSLQVKENGKSPSKNMGYKGPVSGLKGMLSSRIAEGLAQVVQGIDKVGEFVSSGGSKEEGGTTQIPIELIHPCPDQPRQVFEPKALEELSQTLREIGQAQAITVRRATHGFEIISGERRYRAAKLAGFTHLDCVVKEVSRTEGRLLALVENTQRQDLLPIEESEFLKRVLEENQQLSLDKLAKQLGSHKSTVSEKIQLCEMPEEFKSQLYSKGRFFTHRHWRIVSRIADPALLRKMVEKALAEHLSVAELERSVASLGDQSLRRSRKKVEVSRDSGATAGARSSQAEFDLFKKDGKFLRIKSATYDVEKMASISKAKLIEALEGLISELKKESSPVSVQAVDTRLEELIIQQKPSIEIF